LAFEDADDAPRSDVASAPVELYVGPITAVDNTPPEELAVPIVKALVNTELLEGPKPVVEAALPSLLADLTPIALDKPEDTTGPAIVREAALTAVLAAPAVNAKLLLTVCCAPTALTDRPCTSDCAEFLPSAVASLVTRPVPMRPTAMPLESDVAFFPESASALDSAVPSRKGFKLMAPDIVEE